MTNATNLKARGGSIEEVWRRSLRLAPRGVPTFSRFGLAFDLPNLTVEVAVPDPQESVSTYPYPALIEDYRSRLFGSDATSSLLNHRMRQWATGPSRSFDQISAIEKSLRENPESRNAIFALWSPGDIDSAYPASPMAGCFRVLARELHLFALARSVDLWLGLVPEMLVLAELLSATASRLDYRPASLSLQCWSAHLYEADLIRLSAEDV